MRDPYFDNAKVILTLLVVIGHAIQLLLGLDNNALYVFMFIYLFHMPAFALLSGFFCSKAKQPSKNIIKYLLIYIAASLLYLPISSRSYISMMVVPYFHLWYLLSLPCWYALLPFFKKIKHPLIVSVLIAIIAGYFGAIGIVASASRTLVLLPFFLVGTLINRDTITKLKSISKVIPACIILLITLLLPLLKDYYLWIFNSDSYALVGNSAWYSGFIRLAFLLIYALLTLSFLILVPISRIKITSLSKYNFWIYLLHPYLITLIYIVITKYL